MSVTASQLQASLDPTTHVCTLTGIQTFPDGSQHPFSVKVSGTKYDATVALCAAMVSPAALAGGCTLTPAQIATYAGGSGVTTAQIVTYIQQNVATPTQNDAARFWAEIYNLLNLPDAAAAPPTPVTTTPPNISL